MVNEFCLIRCSSCGESKSIFQPWNLGKYLCMDCFNFYGPVAQLDKASVYGTEDYRFDSYRVPPKLTLSTSNKNNNDCL